VTSATRVARVVPDVTGVDKAFDYLVPDDLAAAARVGVRVRVPLHGRNVAGWVVTVAERDAEVPAARLRRVLKVLGLGATPELVALADWASRRWAGPMRALLAAAAPKTLVTRLPPPRHLSRITRTVSPEVDALLARGGGVLRVGPRLDLAPVLAALAYHGPSLVVVPGLQAARAHAASLRSRGYHVAPWPEQWAAARAGVDVVIGARSAVWAPIDDLRLVVVVDEHDDVLQEERAPTWHAREVAIERARRLGVPCVLISPVPSVAARTWAQGRVARIGAAAGDWPEVCLVDRSAGERWTTSLVTPELSAELRDRARRVVCVLNVADRSALSACGACRTILRCEVCDAAVTHRADGILACRRCGTERPVVCQACGSTSVADLRPGVARLRRELEVVARRPVAAVTAATRTVDERCEVFIGTEAVLHRVRHADTVAFLDVDAEVLAPRYRAAEIGAGLFVHAARLVRASPAPRIMAQTLVPTTPLLAALAAGDPDPALEADLARRRELGLPPFGAIAAVSGTGTRAWLEQLATRPAVRVAVEDAQHGMVRVRDWGELGAALLAVPRPARSRVVVHVDPPRA
jgi:primosomal protein N' (replication factor Y)